MEETKHADDNIENYYAMIKKQKLMPIYSDIEKDVVRWNCEIVLIKRIDDSKVIVRMPEENYYNDALNEYEKSNEFDIIEKLILKLNASG